MQDKNLIAILETIEPGRRDAAASLLQQHITRCISVEFSALRSASMLSSRIGGTPFLPDGVAHPCDRSGTPMTLIAQINFAELPACDLKKPKTGLFLLFWNAARDRSNPKDRHAFRCIWIAEPKATIFMGSEHTSSTLVPGASVRFSASWSLSHEKQTDAEISDLALKLSESRRAQILGESPKDFSTLQEIAAFAGNGVSWSQTRRGDSCFSHLIDTAKDWQFFMQINSLPEFGLDIGQLSMNLLIKKEDFDSESFDKAWLIVQ